MTAAFLESAAPQHCNALLAYHNRIPGLEPMAGMASCYTPSTAEVAAHCLGHPTGGFTHPGWVPPWGPMAFLDPIEIHWFPMGSTILLVKPIVGVVPQYITH